MSDPPLWARTDEQVARLQAAKTYGDRWAGCGRPIADGEMVYVERRAPKTPYTPARKRRRLLKTTGSIMLNATIPTRLPLENPRLPTPGVKSQVRR